jgi:hypothetical protein
MNGWMDEEFGLRGDILLPPGNDHWVVGNELVIAINFIGLDFEKIDKFILIFVYDFKIKNYFLQLDDQLHFRIFYSRMWNKFDLYFGPYLKDFYNILEIQYSIY